MTALTSLDGFVTLKNDKKAKKSLFKIKIRHTIKIPIKLTS